MKVIKGLILFCFLGISISACFDPPIFNDGPEISYNKIQFKETPAVGDFDTLILYIDFRDGDGDLGLDDNYLDEPFNDSYYYLYEPITPGDPLDTVRVITEIIDGYIVLKKNGGATGKLVTDRTRTEPGYSSLPLYDANSCLDYSFSQLLVPESDNAVDASYNIIDTLLDQFDDQYFLIEEALLYKRNIYHTNIYVTYEIFENGSWVEFDWFKEFCIDFNGRFPVLTNQEGPLEGTIRYAMPNSSFLALFSVNTLRLKVSIRDRALNISEEVTTPQFTLDGIKVN